MCGDTTASFLTSSPLFSSSSSVSSSLFPFFAVGLDNSELLLFSFSLTIPIATSELKTNATPIQVKKLGFWAKNRISKQSTNHYEVYKLTMVRTFLVFSCASFQWIQFCDSNLHAHKISLALTTETKPTGASRAA